MEYIPLITYLSWFVLITWLYKRKMGIGLLGYWVKQSDQTMNTRDTIKGMLIPLLVVILSFIATYPTLLLINLFLS